MAFFNRRVDPRLPDTVEWDTQIIEGATVAEFAELPARHGIRTTQIFNPDAVACEIADDEYLPFTSLTRILSGNPTASEFYADGGSAYIIVHADNLGKYARATIYPGGTVITAERLASDEFKGATGATGATGAAGATGATGATGPAGPSMPDAINAASDKTTPADADRIGFTDSDDSYNLKRFTFANLWAWIVSKVAALTGKTTPVDADGLLLIDSAAGNAGKLLTWANLKASIAGRVLQDLFQSSAATDTTATAIPNDNTVPQSEEGKEIFTQAITPTNAANKIRVEWCLNIGNDPGVANSRMTALFVDAGASAVAATYERIGDGDPSVLPCRGYYEVAAGSTAARTYKLRWGLDGGTAYLNSQAGTAKLGGVWSSWMRVTEISA